MAEKPNFVFEFRDSIQFKNVPAPIKCYYLLDNTEREEHTAIIVTEDSEQVNYQFMISRATDSPPSTPILNNFADMTAEIEDHQEKEMGCPMFVTPDLNVIKPTPNSTPNPTPPVSRKSSSTDDPDYGAVPPSCPASGPDHFEEGHYHSSTTFMSSMRSSSMTPLREDLDEDDTTTITTTHGSDTNHPNLSTLLTETIVANMDQDDDCPEFSVNDEGIVIRKISDSSSTGSGGEQGGAEALSSCTRLPSRKISDISNHSGESGIESTTSKVSDVSKDGLPCDRDSSKQSLPGPERKLSNSSNGSNTEDELTFMRHTRAGSVSRTIEKFDSMIRTRKSGLPTVATQPHAHNGEPEREWEMQAVSSQSV